MIGSVATGGTAAANGWIDEKRVVLETLLAIREFAFIALKCPVVVAKIIRKEALPQLVKSPKDKTGKASLPCFIIRLLLRLYQLFLSIVDIRVDTIFY